MQRTIYELKGIEVLDYKPRERVASIRIIYLKNGVQEEIIKNFEMVNPAGIVNSVLLEVKKKDKIIIDEPDDVLGNIYITKLENEELVEERLMHFFSKLTGKAKTISSATLAKDYMKLLMDFKTEKISL